MPPKMETEQVIAPVTVLQATNIQEFNSNVESWNVWRERLEIHFCEINCDDEKVKKYILLKSIGPVPYKVLHSLCSPFSPVSKSFEELCQILDSHFTPPTIVFSGRKKFHDAIKSESESVAEWYARVKTLALNCKFGNSLEAFVLNQFVMGLPNFIFERICEEDENLTLQSALKKAMIIETKTMTKEVKEKKTVNFVKKQKSSFQKNKETRRGNGDNVDRGCSRGSSVNNGSRNSGRVDRGNGEKNSCSHCGWRNHSSQSCKYKNSKCHSCGRIGHLASVCRDKRRSVNYVSNDNYVSDDNCVNDHNKDLFNYSIFSVSEGNSSNVYSLPVIIDGIKSN